MTLGWQQTSDAHLSTRCGRFSINRAPPVGNRIIVEPGFLAWARAIAEVDGFFPWGVIGCFRTVPDAMKACEYHARTVFHDAT